MHPPEQKPVQVTRSARNDQLLYFTSTSLLAENRGLIFPSDGDGRRTVYRVDL